MTNFIYNMQDELFDLNMILPVGKFSPIKKLVDHIEAQGKQLRELNAAITKKNATIEKYEREKKDLQERNSCLYKKVVELNNGIRNSEDLTWKQKYEALLHSSEQAIGALQKKCQDYKNSESDAITSTIETLIKTNKELERKNERLKENFEKLEHNYNELINQRNVLVDENKKLERSNLDLGDTIGLYIEEFNKLKAKNKDLLEAKKTIEKRCREVEKALEDEKQVSKDLNVIINSKNNLLDEYMTKYNNLERNYKELKKSVNSEYGMASRKKDYSISYLENRIKTLEEENDNLNKAAETLKKIHDLIHGKE